MNNKPIKIYVVFIDGTEDVYVTNTTDRKAAIADFHAKSWLEINGEFYNKSLIFKWKPIDA